MQVRTIELSGRLLKLQRGDPCDAPNKITTESVLYFHKERLSQAQSEIHFVDDVARGNLTLYRENSRPVVQTPPEEKNNAYFSVRLSESKIGVSNLSNVDADGA